MSARCLSGGFALVTVLIVTAVGLLFGAGALLLFRYQCQFRINRQHELEKVYAVRSALNYIRRYTGVIAEAEVKSFRYYTASGRDLGLVVKPVEPVFPNTNKTHFVMENGDFDYSRSAANAEKRTSLSISPQRAGFYDRFRDCECGVNGDTNLQISARSSKYKGGAAKGLAFTDTSATNSVKWWVNIGMRDTGGWAQEDYGRRYYFEQGDYVVNNSGSNDILRLCIVRNVTNLSAKVGFQHGWPLSMAGERALVFQVVPLDASGNNAEMALFEYECMADGGTVRSTILPPKWVDRQTRCPMGMQIAGDRISMFYVDNAEPNNSSAARGYTFSDSVQMSSETYDYFVKSVHVGGKPYPGIITNDYGEVRAPELRAIFEIEASPGGRNSANVNCLTNFRVTPAYQYDVYLEHPESVTNRATVAQKIGRYNRQGTDYTILTYDTHGTDHKGFRQDEREYARRRDR